MLSDPKKRMPGSGAKHWCFMSFRVDEPIGFDAAHVAYLCYGRGTCPVMGRRYL